MHTSFLSHARFRYLKLAGLLVLVAVLAYAVHEPPVGAYGGTWLGYTLGGLGAAIIGLLLWFGVRKRQYWSRAGSLAGWLSAHVYLGLALVVVATLHSDLQLGWNVHTLAYVLTLLVVSSGIYGVVTYVLYPGRLTGNRAGMRAEAMLAEIAELDREALLLADQIGPRAHQTMLRSIEGTVIGGSFWQQLSGRAPTRRARAQAKAEAELNQLEKDAFLDSLVTDREKLAATQPEPAAEPDTESTMVFMADRLAQSSGSEQVARVRRLLDLVSRKKSMVERLQRDVRFHAMLGAWLFLHVPLSIALLAALLAHVLAVFFYW